MKITNIRFNDMLTTFTVQLSRNGVGRCKLEEDVFRKLDSVYADELYIDVSFNVYDGTWSIFTDVDVTHMPFAYGQVYYEVEGQKTFHPYEVDLGGFIELIGFCLNYATEHKFYDVVQAISFKMPLNELCRMYGETAIEGYKIDMFDDDCRLRTTGSNYLIHVLWDGDYVMKLCRFEGYYSNDDPEAEEIFEVFCRREKRVNYLFVLSEEQVNKIGIYDDVEISADKSK